MIKREISLDTLHLDGIDLTNRCMLITAGKLDDGNYNTMTANWGFFGTIWFNPSVLLVLRPQRYTFEFIKEYEDFTISILPEQHKAIYALMGSSSGRDSDKMNRNPLTAIASEKVASPSYAEACLTLECQKLYIGDLDGNGIVDPHIIEEDYPNRDFHKMVIGKIVHAWKTEDF